MSEGIVGCHSWGRVLPLSSGESPGVTVPDPTIHRTPPPQQRVTQPIRQRCGG